MRAATALLVALVAACHPAAATTPEASSDTTPEALLIAVARGQRTLLSLADPARGIAYAARYDDMTGEDPRSDEGGVIRIDTRVCASPDRAMDAAAAELARHFAPDFDFTPLTCEGLTCTAGSSGEYTHAYRFVFVREATGALVLTTVLEVEEAAILEDIAVERWHDAERSAAALPGGCP